MAILSIKNLYKFYKKKCLINNVTFNIHSGEIVGLLGPNGAGKTTIFHIILGIIQHNSGHIFLDKTNISIFPIYLRTKLGISYLPQESSIFQNLTVFENLMAILQMQKFSKKKEHNNLIQKIMNEFHINHLKNNMGRNLSGGERKRVEIARALISRPKFILFDEPFSGVDPISITNIQEIIKKLKKNNLGILITDHNVRDILKICDRLYIFNEGKILTQGSLNKILCNKYVKKIYLGNSFKL